MYKVLIDSEDEKKKVQGVYSGFGGSQTEGHVKIFLIMYTNG